jgi:hypothetical protein
MLARQLEYMARKRLLQGAVVCMTIVLSASSFAFADTLQSSHYQLIESDVGGGGLVQSNSANFKSVLSVSDTAVGDSASANFQSQAGSQTSPDPALSFIINNANATFSGPFSPTATATATNSCSISNYTSYGYSVQIVGSTPTNGGHSIPAMGTDADGGPAFSQVGHEQFGMNMVANTDPSSFGLNPDNGQFGFGTVQTTNYKTANKYRYASGEAIASAPKSSGVTTYTISYIVNVSSLTPGGRYTSSQQIIVIGTY